MPMPHLQGGRPLPLSPMPGLDNAPGSQMFQNATGFDIQGGQFISAQGGVHFHQPVSTQMPLPMPSETFSENEVYCSLLCQRQRGFPLYVPEPQENLPSEYLERGVSIGDVGMITPEGIWDFFFNIFLPANGPINRGRVPPNYSPLEPYDESDAHNLRYEPGSFLSTSTARCYNANFEEFPGGDYHFQCTSPKGAILCLPFGSRLHKLSTGKDHVRNYAVQNAKSWYHYINGTLGKGMMNGELYVITGTEKASAGGIATFQNVAERDNFDLTFRAFSDTHTHLRYRFNRGTVAQTKSFPSPRPDDGGAELNNNTIFLHGFIISLGLGIWGTLFNTVGVYSIEDASPQRLAGGSVPFGSQSSNFSLFGFMSSGTGNTRNIGKRYIGPQGEGVGVSELVDSIRSVHPGRIINDYILSKIEDDQAIVVTHDEDWETLLLDPGVNLYNILESTDRIKITTEDGIAYPIITSASPAPDPPPPPYAVLPGARRNIWSSGYRSDDTASGTSASAPVTIPHSITPLSVSFGETISSSPDDSEPEIDTEPTWRQWMVSRLPFGGSQSQWHHDQDTTQELDAEPVDIFDSRPMSESFTSTPTTVESTRPQEYIQTSHSTSLSAPTETLTHSAFPDTATALPRSITHPGFFPSSTSLRNAAAVVSTTTHARELLSPSGLPIQDSRTDKISSTASKTQASNTAIKSDSYPSRTLTATPPLKSHAPQDHLQISTSSETPMRPSVDEIYASLDEFFPDYDLDAPPDSAKGKTLSTSSPSAVGDSIRMIVKSRKVYTTPLAPTHHLLSSAARIELSSSHPLTWLRGELITRGTHGNVYLSLNATNGDVMAVKRTAFPSPNTIKLVAADLQTLKRLKHPNIARYLEIESTPAFCNIFLEYVPGGSIDSHLQEHGKFADDVTKHFISQILSGLDYLHRNEGIHGDLKSKNVLVDMSGVCKIAGFGYSEIYSERTQQTLAQSRSTIFWTAPEVLNQTDKHYTFKIDIWSLGCIAQEMWTGSRPWAGHETANVFSKLLQSTIPPLPKDTKLTEDADDFRQKCLAIKPEFRLAASELLVHLYLTPTPGWVFDISKLGVDALS
ncbi:Pleiotropic drug resistance ABC transporter protein [Mycena indigotica]|uniref:Pleiotropic drug resistance ABC transporter protein n=1 Tax=Mycena indigotica TaxID=2126181 RepID=A0A8H6T7Y0_9AGAR|nr:Pleiotropic drug resistance ABC transporter protein [Mycena indigotica]KAF7312570.1 Pleiotropic drug resistance ABC transporter protein [Mycena indigotica]